MRYGHVLLGQTIHFPSSLFAEDVDPKLVAAVVKLELLFAYCTIQTVELESNVALCAWVENVAYFQALVTCVW
jgi:hypothetical protein